MEEVILKLLTAVERLGAPGAIGMAVLWYLRGRELEKARADLAASQEKRIEQAMTVTAVVEGARTQMALVLGTMKELQEVVRKLLDRRSRSAE
jgi:hypothetical protein